MKLSMRESRFGGLSLFGVGLLVSTGLVSASPITGTFGFTGPGVLTFSSSGDFIDFCSSVSGTTCNNNGSGTGNFTVTGPGTNSFSVLTSTTPGTIDDLTDVTPPAPGYTYLPVGVPVMVNNIIALSGFPTWDFQADMLPLASCISSATQQCLGPFQLNQNGQNVSVDMNIEGMIINTADSSTSTLDLTITGNYLNTTIAAVEAGATSPGGVFSNNWSGSVVATAVPEPGTAGMMLLAGTGLLLLAPKRKSRRL